VNKLVVHHHVKGLQSTPKRTFALALNQNTTLAIPSEAMGAIYAFISLMLLVCEVREVRGVKGGAQRCAELGRVLPREREDCARVVAGLGLRVGVEA
jgi:hypothetical protein